MQQFNIALHINMKEKSTLIKYLKEVNNEVLQTTLFKERDNVTNITIFSDTY